jgi:hypothetical protein
MLVPLGIMASSGGAPKTYELIATTFGTGSSGTITFSSIPATYKHLQIRATPKSNDTNAIGNLSMRMNGDSASNYSWHFLQGYGTGAWSSNGTSASFISLRDYLGTSGSLHGAIIIDLLDYANTNKNKTVRAFSGLTNGSTQNQVSLVSGNWRSTSAVTSLTLTAGLGSFVTPARFSLYGIKG